MFAAEEARARALYKSFIEQRIATEPGALDPNPLERRVLGDDAFLDRLSVPVRKRLASRTLDDLVGEICRTHELTVEVVRSPRQNRAACRARALIAAGAISEQIATLSEVARFLNRSASALSRAIERYGGSI